MEDDRKNALARKVEEAERLANENRRQAEERERYKAACELAMELERKVDETRRVDVYDRLVVAIGEFMGGPQDELDAPQSRLPHTRRRAVTGAGRRGRLNG